MKKIIFVYNANSGYMNAVVDALHKSIKPSTYACDLCAMTYGAVSMKKQWKEFVDSLPNDTEFLHKDEFEKKYPSAKQDLPAILTHEKDTFTQIVSPKDFKRLDELDDLIKMVQSKI